MVWSNNLSRPCFLRAITSCGDYMVLKAFWLVLDCGFHGRSTRVGTIWELRGKRQRMESKLQKDRKPYIIPQSHTVTWWPERGLLQCRELLPKILQELELRNWLQTCLERPPDTLALVYRSLCFPLTAVPGTSHFPSRVEFCIHCPHNARLSWQPDSLAARKILYWWSSFSLFSAY